MSLDVYLVEKITNVPCICDCGHEHTKEERKYLYDSRITHNLGPMARDAGIYQHLWRPEEIGITKAYQLIEPLRGGIALLKSDPPRFEKFNAPNGWGNYGELVSWVEQYLNACEKYTDADVRVSR